MIGIEENLLNTNAKDLAKDLANGLLSYVIYGGLLIQDKKITLKEIKGIIYGDSIPSISVKDVLDITDIKCAWKYAVKNFNVKIDVDFLCKINKEICWANIQKRGTLRKTKLPISGICKPLAEPDALLMKKALNVIQSQEVGVVTKALKLFAYIMRVKPFLHGNTLTAYLVSNKFLVENGSKIMYCEEKKLEEFWEKSIKYDGGKINEDDYCKYLNENLKFIETTDVSEFQC